MRNNNWCRCLIQFIENNATKSCLSCAAMCSSSGQGDVYMQVWHNVLMWQRLDQMFCLSHGGFVYHRSECVENDYNHVGLQCFKLWFLIRSSFIVSGQHYKVSFCCSQLTTVGYWERKLISYLACCCLLLDQKNSMMKIMISYLRNCNIWSQTKHEKVIQISGRCWWRLLTRYRRPFFSELG